MCVCVCGGGGFEPLPCDKPAYRLYLSPPGAFLYKRHASSLPAHVFELLPARRTSYLCFSYISQCMRFPTMWYVRPAKPKTTCTYAQSDQSLYLSLEYFMTVKLLTERHLEFLSFKGCIKDWSESTLVKMPHCWKSHVTAHLLYFFHIKSLCHLPQANIADFGPVTGPIRVHLIYNKVVKTMFVITNNYFLNKASQIISVIK